MYIIVIGEEEEYGKRLMRYLEGHMPEPIRLYCFTRPDSLLQFEEEADIYLLGEYFYENLSQQEGWEQWAAEIRKSMICITNVDKPGAFCRYHKPERLVDMICTMLSSRKSCKGKTEDFFKTQITAVFSPKFEENLRQFAMQCMESGDLYLGMEDMGLAAVVGDKEGMITSGSNMGDLCYFIHLREESLPVQLKEMIQEEEGKYYLDSPNLYFDLMELEKEEYEWFFQKLEEMKEFSHIFLGTGSAAFQYLYYLRLLDSVILVDSREDMRLHTCCIYLDKMLQAKNYLSGEYTKIYREDFML